MRINSQAKEQQAELAGGRERSKPQSRGAVRLYPYISNKYFYVETSKKPELVLRAFLRYVPVIFVLWVTNVVTTTQKAKKKWR